MWFAISMKCFFVMVSFGMVMVVSVLFVVERETPLERNCSNGIWHGYG
jgi:hypothetical protein